MPPTIPLPSDKLDLARVVWNYVFSERQRVMYPLHTAWNLYDLYMGGYRRFDAFKPNGQRIGAHYLTDEGSWLTQVNEIVMQVNKVVGELRSLDLHPSLERESLSLAAIRDRASGQILADSLVSEQAMFQPKADFAQLLTQLGTVGLQGEVQDDPVVGLTADYEVVDPREIYAFPTAGANRTKIRGHCRLRLVPVDYLIDVYGAQVKRNLKNMDVRKRIVGSSEELTADHLLGSRGLSSFQSSTMNTVVRNGDYLVALVCETWLHGPRGTCARYIISSRDHIIHDGDYRKIGVEVYPSLSVARFLDNSQFYGVGYCQILFSVVRIFEQLVDEVAKNAREIGRYPVTLIPSGLVKEQQLMKDDGGTGLRFATYTPESKLYMGRTSIRPVTIAPHAQGADLPGRTAAFMLNLIDRYSLLGDLRRDKGRIDSFAALQFMDEKDKQPLTVPFQETTNCWSSAHRHVVVEGGRMIMDTPRAIPVSRLDLGLIGAAINFDDNTVDFRRNPIPDISRLKVKTRSTSTISVAGLKQEAMQHLKEGTSPSPLHTRAYFISKGIDVAIWMEDEIGAYRTAVQNILTIYNDGITPGFTWISPVTDKSGIALMVVEGFLGSPELRAASPDVINALVRYYKTLLRFNGQMLPEAVPDPNDAALLGDQTTGMMEGQTSPPQLAGAT